MELDTTNLQFFVRSILTERVNDKYLKSLSFFSLETFVAGLYFLLEFFFCFALQKRNIAGRAEKNETIS